MKRLAALVLIAAAAAGCGNVMRAFLHLPPPRAAAPPAAAAAGKPVAIDDAGVTVPALETTLNPDSVQPTPAKPLSDSEEYLSASRGSMPWKAGTSIAVVRTSAPVVGGRSVCA